MDCHFRGIEERSVIGGENTACRGCGNKGKPTLRTTGGRELSETQKRVQTMEEVKVRFRAERPNELDLRAHSVWCQYQCPDEMDDLRDWGVSDQIIQSEILDEVESDHCHPYYSVPDQAVVPDRDYLLIAVDMHIDAPELDAFGYMVLSDGEPSSLVIFFGDEELVFYNDPPEDGYNHEPLQRLFQSMTVDAVVAKISPKRDIPGIISPTSFEIPV
jgi:hypothetical protein